MSANRLHVAVGDSGAGMLQALRRDGLLDGEVLAFIEDLSAGPLLDADAIDQGLRLAWHQQLLQAQPWSPEYEDDWLRRHQASRRALLRLLEQPRPLTVWLGRNAGDHLALALLAEQLPAHCPLSVVAVPEPAWQAGDEMAEWSLAMLPLERLAACLPQQLPISAAERQALAAQWRHWREHGLGLRRWQGNAIVEAPLERYDARCWNRSARTRSLSSAWSAPRSSAFGKRWFHPIFCSGACSNCCARADSAPKARLERRVLPANPPLRLSPSCYSATSVLKDYSKRLVMHRRAGKIPALDACPAIEWQRPAILRNPTP